MRHQYHMPLDPDCPLNPLNREPDPMDDYCGCMDEIDAGAITRHRKFCKRCQEFGAANIEVI